VVTIDSAPEQTSCRIYEYCYTQGTDEYLEELDATATIVRAYDSGTAKFETRVIDGTYDSDTGYVYWDIVQGAKVCIKIIGMGIDKKITVPFSEEARLGEL